MGDSIFIKRVVLSNYKSIQKCAVRLGPLTFLVGQNGAGKSNFLDALSLVTESLNTSLEHALRERGGINEVMRKSSEYPADFGIRLDWKLPDSQGWYAFRVGATKKTTWRFAVEEEECRVLQNGLPAEQFYRIENGLLKESSLEVVPPPLSDRLFLVAAAGLAPFRPIYDALAHMGFYNLNPDAIRAVQPSDPGEVLKRDGSNLASVLSVMSREDKESYDRVVAFLSKAVPGIRRVDVGHAQEVGGIQGRGVLVFDQVVGPNSIPRHFVAENMSDGTLRALGVLASLFQSANGDSQRVPFVGIEEPEVALHPGAAGVLRDALRVASHKTQVAVTSHSPDLLDDKDIPDTNILAVVNRQGATIIGQLDEAGRSSILDRLYTAGELLRLNQLEPDMAAVDAVPPSQLDLFAE